MKDASTTGKDGAFFLFGWIKYFEFDKPGTEVPLYLLSQINSVISSWYADNTASNGILDDFIKKAGSSWSSKTFEDFYLDSSPTNKGFVGCDGVTTETYNGLTPGYALNEFTGISLN